MKPGICITLFFLFSTCTLLQAQSLTGVWRGYFNSGYGNFKQKYKYEVQINQLGNQANQKGLQGVTYSYHSTVFYGKATLQGIYDPKALSLTIKELKLVELKISDNSQPCLMTCYLDYRKEGKTEILEGTFTSIVEKSKADCGSGYVYLERVEESDFYKEDFLIKKVTPTSKPPVAKTNPPATTNQQQTAKTQPKTTTKPPATKSTATAPPPVKKTTPPATTQKNTTGSNNSTTKKTAPPQQESTIKKEPKTLDTIARTKPGAPPVITQPGAGEIKKKNIPVPDMIRDRENPLVRRITTGSQDIRIELYDNGDIDGDTITVYNNNEVIAYRKGLTGKPITINIKADEQNPHHEFIMAANNLGSIPPNTALMVITTDGKRYELFLSADEKKNAKVIIDYKSPGK